MSLVKVNDLLKHATENHSPKEPAFISNYAFQMIPAIRTEVALIEAAMMPQTLLAFVGFSGKSVKIVIPFTLPDGLQQSSIVEGIL